MGLSDRQFRPICAGSVGVSVTSAGRSGVLLYLPDVICRKSRGGHRRRRAASAGRRRWPCPRAGASVVAVGRDKSALEAVVAELHHAGTPAIAVVADLTASDAPDAIVDATVARFGGIDVVVNAAGVIGFGSTDQTADELWDSHDEHERARAVPPDARRVPAPEGASRQCRQRVERQRPARVSRACRVQHEQSGDRSAHPHAPPSTGRRTACASTR